MTRYVLVALGLCVFLALAPAWAAFESVPLIIKTQAKKTLTFQVEVARTPAEQERGLMGRRTLAPEKGMLFVFATPREAWFWMRKTYIPLDMVFIAADGKIVKIHKQAKPLDETMIGSDVPVIAVLEVLGGTADRLGFGVGNRVISPPLVKAPPDMIHKPD